MRSNRDVLLVKCPDLNGAISFITFMYALGYRWVGDCYGGSNPILETHRILGHLPLESGVFLHMPIRKGCAKSITYSLVPHIYDARNGRKVSSYTILSPERFREVYHG